MPSVPLPFIVALLLAILTMRIARYSEESWTRKPLLAFVAVCAVLAALVGLRWSYDLPLARFAQLIVASALPAIAWLGFGGLRGSVEHRALAWQSIGRRHDRILSVADRNVQMSEER
jgi:hypothetical protein